MAESKIISVLEKFPKKRIPLPQAYQQIYMDHYFINRKGGSAATSLAMKMEKWLHKKVAQDVKGNSRDIKTLEIGAGYLNQLVFEPNIISYDIVEPCEDFYNKSPFLPRVRKIYNDISEVTESYSRITSIATFEHIVNLPEVIAKAALLLEKNGTLRIAIPNEGTLLWKMGTKLTNLDFKKRYKLDYNVLMNYEHVNTANEIECLLKYFFRKSSVKVFGINRRLAFYRFIVCSDPIIDKAKAYLKNRNAKANV
jgi:hypothetical protein